jgi:hypothetical protein
VVMAWGAAGPDAAAKPAVFDFVIRSPRSSDHN